MSSLAGFFSHIGDSFKQYIVLSRHFFIRLFINDIVAFEDQMKERIIGILALFAILCGHISNVALFKYALYEDKGTSWVEKCYVMTFFMILIGFIAVLEWDVILPDSRDYSNLFPLPISIRNLFIAKFTSLFIFVAMFAFAINALSVLTFAFYLPKWQSDTLGFGLRFVMVHVLSSTAAIFFMFFSVLLFLGILMTVLGNKLFNRISVFIRTVFLAGLVLLLTLFINNSTDSILSLPDMLTLKAFHSIRLYLLPPMWFTGLYETLLGNDDVFFHGLANLGIGALLISIAAYYLISGLSYRSSLKTRISSVVKKLRHSRTKKCLSRYVNALFLRHPVKRAVFDFFGNTLRRNMLHKMRLASFLAVGFGIVLILIVPYGNNLAAATEFMPQLKTTSVDKVFLSASLIITIFLLVGLKSIMNLPIQLDANWIFKLTEVREIVLYFSGLRMGILFHALAPLFALFFIFYFFLWGPELAALHCLYGVIWAVISMEVLFLKYNKIPFCCSYVPGKEKIHMLWLVYFSLFILTIFLLVKLELILLTSPQNFVYFLLFFLTFMLIFRVYQNKILLKKRKIKYEEEIPQALVGLSQD